MSVTFDTRSDAGTFSNATTVSWTHTPTPGISNPCAIVTVNWAKVGDITPTVTYNGVSMVLDSTGVSLFSGVVTGKSMMFQLTGIDTSAGHTVLIDFGVAGNYGNAGCQTYSGVSQGTPLGTAVVNFEDYTGPGSATDTATLSVAAGNMGVDTLILNSGDGAPTGNRTSNYNGAGTGYYGACQDTAVSGSVGMQWSWALALNGYAHVANTILAAASSPIPAIAWQLQFGR